MTDLIELYQIPWVRALTVLGVSILCALFLDRFVIRALLWAAGRTDTDWDDRMVGFVKMPIVVSFVLVGLGLAVAALGWQGTPRFVSIALLKTVALVVWTRGLFRAVSAVLAALQSREKVNDRMVPFLEMVFKIVISGGAIYFGFLAWRIDVTGWLASAGILGIAIGFAAKDTLANLFAGFFILADAPYKLGDMIVLGDGTRGIVTNIGMRSTRLLTRDDVEITVPNNQIGNGLIMNESGGPALRMRLKVPITVAYGTEIEQAKSLMLDAIQGIKGICDRPPPRAFFVAMGDNALEFQLFVFIVRPSARDQVVDQINTAVYNALNKANINIPFPQRDVYIKSQPT